MGMYTALHLNIELERNTTLDVIWTLEAMTGKKAPTFQFDHPLFDTARWDFMLQCSSYYHKAWSASEMVYDDTAKCYFLRVQCDFKNYDSEIELFLDWIDPYIRAEPGEFLGYYRYEEDVEPTIIYKR